MKLLDPDDWEVLTRGGGGGEVDLKLTIGKTEALANRKFDVPCSSPAKRKRILGKGTTRPWMHVYASSILKV